MEYSVYDIALVPVICALVSLLETLGIPKRWLPAVALVLGLAAGWFYVAPADPKQAVLAGVVMGLSAVGLFSGVKNTLGK